MKLSMLPVPVEGVINKACLLLNQKARSKSIDIQRVTGKSSVVADIGRLEQVLVNLLDNAIKYTPENGLIRISTKEEGDTVTISVTDTGVGIGAKHLPRIFERFYRVDPARSRSEQSTGLGLSIVKHIIQLHGGEVAVQSTPGAGSTFSITLPKAAAAEPQDVE
jgi:two-component system phosphate regulon sensor histidine kinase PhoR